MDISNIVLITIDCLRYDRCGFNGHGRNTTPVLDELANESFLFDHAYATGPYTTESVPGIIAGQHSYNGAHFGDHVAWKAIPPSSSTLATYLRDYGYQTVATLANPHLTRERHFDQGFQQFRNLRTAGKSNGDGGEADGLLKFVNLDLMRIRSRMRRYKSLFNPYTLPYVAYRYSQYRTDWPSIQGEQIVNELISDIEDADEPLFAWTHLMDLHAPINPRAIRQGGLSQSNWTLRHLLADAARAGWIQEPTYDDLYDSALRYVDSCIGNLITKLKQQGRWEDTVLLMTSDHGEVLFDRNGIYGHPRHHLYDELLHVPLLVRTPGGEGERINRPFSLAWIHELLSEILDIEPGTFPAQYNGGKILRDSNDGSPVIISDSLDGTGHSIAVRDGRHKLLTHARCQDAEESEYIYFDRDIIFQYITDHGERIPKESSVVSDLKTRARKLSVHPEDHPSIEGGFEPEIEQRLRDLGYRM